MGWCTYHSNSCRCIKSYYTNSRILSRLCTTYHCLPSLGRNTSSTITIGHIDECHYVSTAALQSNASISMCNELTDATQSSRNKHFIMYIYAVCSSVIKSCSYWDCSTLQALHEHACLLYEKCCVDRVGKLPSNITVWSDFKDRLFKPSLDNVHEGHRLTQV